MESLLADAQKHGDSCDSAFGIGLHNLALSPDRPVPRRDLAADSRSRLDEQSALKPEDKRGLSFRGRLQVSGAGFGPQQSMTDYAERNSSPTSEARVCPGRAQHNPEMGIIAVMLSSA